MKKILVPTDFSVNAANAVRFAYLFSKENGYKFSLINVYNFSVYDPNMPPEILADVIKQSEENSGSSMGMLISEFVKEYPDFENFLSDKVIAVGGVVESIEKTASEGKFDFIIMGTKGASGIEEVLIGSNAYSVLAKANIPVFVIPEKSVYKNFNTILYTVDLTCSEIFAINKFQELVDLKNKDITFLHLREDSNEEFEDKMSDDEKKCLDEIKDNLKDVSVKFEFAKCENVADAIEDYVHKLNIDLIVVSKKKRNFLDNLFHKSISKKLACHTDIPLLALHK